MEEGRGHGSERFPETESLTVSSEDEVDVSSRFPSEDDEMLTAGSGRPGVKVAPGFWNCRF